MKIRKPGLSMIFPAAVPGVVPVTTWLVIFIRNSSSFTLNMAEAFLLAGAAWAISSLLLFFILYTLSFFPWHKWVTAGLLGFSCSLILQYHLAVKFFGAGDYLTEISADSLLLLSCHVLMLILPVAAALWQRERCCKWCTRISLILILMQFTVLIHSIWTAPKTSVSYDFKEYSFSEKEKFSFGTKENIIVLVVDCMGERILKEVLSHYPELQKSFRDFTCFDRMVSPLPRTMYAVPALLTGIDFPCVGNGVPSNQDHGIFLHRVCREKSSLLQLAKAKNFRVEGYPFILQTISYAPEVIDNSEIISHAVQKESALKILEVMMERLVPVFLRDLLYDEAEMEMIPFVRQGAADGPDGLSYDQNFYRRLKKEFRTGRFEKVFKYLHLHGAHEPVTADENLLSKENTLKLQQLRGSLKIVELLFQKLKEHGLYDSSTIIITGDHTERYTPEIAALIKRPFERKMDLVFNSAPCQISQLSGTAAKAAGLDPHASSVFDQAFIPGSIKDVRENKKQFPGFTGWKKINSRKKITPGEIVKGNYQLRGKRLMIELEGENTFQSAEKVTVTAENILTSEQYETTLIKSGSFRDLLLPEPAFPDGDYLLTLTEKRVSADRDLYSYSRVIPLWLRLKGPQMSILYQAPDLFHLAVSLDETMTFHPFSSWRGIRFTAGSKPKWGSVLIRGKGMIQLRLPKSAAVYRAEINCAPFVFEKGYIEIAVNGQKPKRWPVKSIELQRCILDLVPDQNGIVAISLEFHKEEKIRTRKKSYYFNCGRIFNITVRSY